MAKPYSLKKCARDLDDSSDEEDLKSKNSQAVNYEQGFKNFSEKNKELKESPTAYVVHVIANRLLYSNEVNNLYYKKKESLCKVTEPLATILEKMCDAIINSCDAVEKYSVNEMGYPVDKDGYLVVKFSRFFIDGLSVKLESLEALTKKEFIKSLKDILLTNLSNEIYKEIQGSVSILGYREAKSSKYLTKEQIKNFKISQDLLVTIALRSIAARLDENKKMLSKNHKNRGAELESPFKNLAAKTWSLLEDLKGGSDPEKKLTDWNTLKKAFILDLLELDNKFSWSYVSKNPWLAKFLTLDNDRLKELIEWNTKIAILSFLKEMYNSKRPTLTDNINYCNFYSSNAVELLANIRHFNCSLKRTDKNLQEDPLAKKIYAGNSPQKFQLHWNFFSTCKKSALENTSISASSHTRTNYIENFYTYKDLHNQILIFKEFLTKANIKFDDKTFALWIRATLQGKFEDQYLTSLPASTHNTIMERLNTITYLLFGCEVFRNPASLIIHQMALDLMILKPGEYTWDTLLKGARLPLPMRKKGSIDRSRYLNTVFTSDTLHVFPYKYDYSSPEKDFGPLLDDEEKIAGTWLGEIDDLSPDLNDMAKTICIAFKDWFGKNCFNLENFLRQNSKFELIDLYGDLNDVTRDLDIKI